MQFVVPLPVEVTKLGPRAVAKTARELLLATAHINVLILQAYPWDPDTGKGIPPLYVLGRQGRMRWKNEPWAGQPQMLLGRFEGIEEFATIPTVIKRGWGDCDDLSPWKVAALWLGIGDFGERIKPQPKADIRVKWNPDLTLYHIQVRDGRGRELDPSKWLGMPTAENPTGKIGVVGGGLSTRKPPNKRWWRRLAA